MKMKQSLIKLVLPVAMLISGVSSANVITVATPALDVQQFSLDSGVNLAVNSFSIDATAYQVITDNIYAPIDVPDEIFTLTATPDNILGTYSGTFSAGSLLSGTFSGLSVLSTPNISQFSGNVTYTGGSLKGNLTGGTIVGTFMGTTLLGAKIGAVSAVPVPAAVWLFGSGLLGLVGIARRKA